ncbi:MAG: hypothetical protein A2Z31_03840 [candidate division NC10 bacterium RBG_16_65_8]|nr:MAG: hypothetical protein A2Z31_03840 [candidate division NC10 bacterium RBG_16_65_8]
MASRDLLRGLALLESGDWHGAHALAQADPSSLGSWLHGIVHMVEPDQGNSMYWYRQADRPFPGMDAAAAEINVLRAALNAIP